MHRFVGILGMLTMLSLAYIFSTDRRAIRHKTVAWGLGLQIAFAFIVMRWETGRYIFQRLGAAVNWFLDFAYYGSSFIFGDLGSKELAQRASTSRFRRFRRSSSSPQYSPCSTTTESCRSS